MLLSSSSSMGRLILAGTAPEENSTGALQSIRGVFFLINGINIYFKCVFQTWYVGR